MGDNDLFWTETLRLTLAHEHTTYAILPRKKIQNKKKIKECQSKAFTTRPIKMFACYTINQHAFSIAFATVNVQYVFQ